MTKSTRIYATANRDYELLKDKVHKSNSGTYTSNYNDCGGGRVGGGGG